MADNSEAKDREVKARLSIGIATMKRLGEGWQRLFGCVERDQMPAASALRGFQLVIEAALGKSGVEAALGELDEFVLSVAERNELTRLQARVAELEGELTAAKHENELRAARIAEFKELLEAERTPDEGKPAAETAAGAKRARRPSVPPPEKSGDPVEGWWATIVSFFSLYGYKLGVPRPAVTAEELARGRAEERELIYRPPEARVSYDELMAAHGFHDHSTLQPEDRSRIGFVPTGEGYWFWVEAREIASRRGKSFEDFVKEAPPGWEILSLEEHFLAWAVMNAVHCTSLDPDEPVCLRTAYRAAYKIKDGTSEVLQVRSHVVHEKIELIVRGLPRTARLNGKLGVRYRQLVSSVSTRG